MVETNSLAEVLREAADAVVAALGDTEDWGPSGRREGQFASDLVADAAALKVLDAAGVGVLSEESGRHRPEMPVTVVLDPLDGSTNASRGIPWYATSLCAVDSDGPCAALVVNLVTGDRFAAERGRGATLNGKPIRPSGATHLNHSLIGLSGYPPRYLGWRQYRSLGAVALDLCAVGAGVLDGFMDCSFDAHGSWDYMAGLLVCTEAGAYVADASGRELVALDHSARLTPIAGATPQLLEEVLAARASFDPEW